MNVNKKLDRLKHWAGERMGGEVKTTTTDDFKQLELEMTLRHEGMEKLHKTMNTYVQAMAKRCESDNKEKTLPITAMGSTMVAHGGDFEPDSDFGRCLTDLGRAHERLGRLQETYIDGATTTWLSSLEKSLAQMKEYQASRKKLESRRLAFDTSQTKLNKSKKEDFRMEEDFRSQKAKYEESSEIVYRRMLDIKEAEMDSVNDISAFLDAELSYHDRAREVLLALKKTWPVETDASPISRQTSRIRSNTLGSDRGDIEDNAQGLRIPTRPRVSSAHTSAQNSPRRDLQMDLPTSTSQSSSLHRYSTFEGPQSTQRDESPAVMPRLTRLPTDSAILTMGRSQLRSGGQENSVFGDDKETHAPDISYRQPSPGLSPGYLTTRSASMVYKSSQDMGLAKKAPPPPPPSRSKKPPPPTPLQRNAMSSSGSLP